MKYSEIFYSIQGEGQLVGLPSVFFRTSYCNLRCIWCDTPYTSWQPEDKDISVEDAVTAILAYNCPQVVITGGEPFMQAKELTNLCQQLHQQGQHITIETNGTLFQQVEADLLSISPKLANSNPATSNHHFQQHQSLRINQPVLRQFLDQYKLPTEVRSGNRTGLSGDPAVATRDADSIVDHSFNATRDHQGSDSRQTKLDGGNL